MNGHGGIDIIWLQQQFPNLSNLVALTPGGQKQVFAAAHPQNGSVVLKIIHPRQDVETTRREVLAVVQLRAARIPRILETGTLQTQLGNCFWFREQKIDGQTLRQCIQSGPLPVREVLRLGLQLLETLLIAEQVRIVHRDVKPENIIRDNSGQFWLIDFGIARHLDLPSQTATHFVFGKFTPGYAPREQYRNIKDDIDARCDLFATGVTLYESAMGQNPFTHNVRDTLEIFRRVETQPLPRLNVTCGQAAAFGDLVAAMTQRRRDHRPASVAEAHGWMQQICNAEGI